MYKAQGAIRSLGLVFFCYFCYFCSEMIVRENVETQKRNAESYCKNFLLFLLFLLFMRQNRYKSIKRSKRIKHTKSRKSRIFSVFCFLFREAYGNIHYYCY